MAKPELGTKRVCPACGTKYYDLLRNPIACPNCGTIFEVAAHHKAGPARAAQPAPDEEAEVESAAEPEVDVVSLEEVEEEAEADVGPDADEDEAVADPDALVIDAEITPEDEPAFLDEEEEEGDVTGLLDVDAEPEDEV